MKNVAGAREASSTCRMRPAATRDPYSPSESATGSVTPVRSGIVSWSASNDSATATRAPPGHGRTRRRPARTRATCARHSGSSHCHGSGFPWFVDMACTLAHNHEYRDDSGGGSVSGGGGGGVWWRGGGRGGGFATRGGLGGAGERERFAVRRDLTLKNVNALLLPAMRAHGIDMWIVLDREYHPDPLSVDIGGEFGG